MEDSDVFLIDVFTITSGKQIFAFRVDSKSCCSKSDLVTLQTFSILCCWIRSLTSKSTCALWMTSRTFLALPICELGPLKNSFSARYTTLWSGGLLVIVYTEGESWGESWLTEVEFELRRRWQILKHDQGSKMPFHYVHPTRVLFYTPFRVLVYLSFVY